MYIEVENKFIVLRVYDDGSFVAKPKPQYKESFNRDLLLVKNGKMSPSDLEKMYGIDALKEQAIQQYKKFLPTLEEAVEDFESFIKTLEALK